MSATVDRVRKAVDAIAASSRRVGHATISPAELAELVAATGELADAGPSSAAAPAAEAPAGDPLVWLGHGWGPRPTNWTP